MFKKTDYIIISIIFFFFGVFVVSQYRAGKAYLQAVAPESSATMALEVARLTKSNAGMRSQIKKLTLDLDSYRNSSESQKTLYEKYNRDLSDLNIINGLSSKSGQGVEIAISGKLSTAQVVDFVNAIKNIGSDLNVINETRVLLDTDMSIFSNKPNYQILVYGNSRLLKSALERKGGIVEQISNKDIKISIAEKESVIIPAGKTEKFKYSKEINN